MEKRGSACLLLRIKQVIPFCLLYFLLYSPLISAAQSASEKTWPNILWISVEDISPLLGVYGDRIAKTPVIDKLAEDGMLFTHAFSTSGVCSPSRTAIITGMHQASIGAHHHRPTHTGHSYKTTADHEPLVGMAAPYQVVPPPYVKTFTEYLRAAGYYTTNDSKTDYNFGLPVTAWDESGRQAHWRNAPEGHPFFSVVNIGITHEAQIWPDPGRPLTVDPAAVEVPPYLPDTPVVRQDIAQQYSNIQRMDSRVGQILAELEEDGLADKTVVFFWSDHGGALPRQKSWIYDSGIHVPLIIRWPGVVEPGSVNGELVSLIDLAPTVLSIADVNIPSHMQGRALLGSQRSASPTYIYAAADRHDEVYDMMRAVRDAQFKYIRNYFPNQPYLGMNEYRHRMPVMQEILRLRAEGNLEGAETFWQHQTRPAEELYDVTKDPHEIVNLARESIYGEVLGRMRKAMDEWMNRIGDMGHIPEEQLRRQFWPEGKQPVTEQPYFVVNAAEDRGRIWRREGGSFTAPYLVYVTATTHGASIAYTTETGEDPHWRLYAGPIKISERVTLRAKAARYGYAPSKEVEATFDVQQASK